VRETPLNSGFYGSSYYGAEETNELNDVIKTQRPFRWYGPGKEPPMKAATFEKEFAKRMQTRYALGLTSGSAALQTAVAALGIGPRRSDPAGLDLALLFQCHCAGWRACRCLPRSTNPSTSIPRHRKQNHSADQVDHGVHLQGNPADMDAIHGESPVNTICASSKTARQSVGASYKGKPVGSIGDINIYSCNQQTITAERVAR